MPVEFDLAPTQKLHAECRFFLKRLEPDFELYVSPLNLDPLAPALPISHAGRLRRRAGARDRPVLHAGHARRHQGAQDRRADAGRVPAPRRASPATKSSGSTATCSIGSATACSSTTSATSIRCRT